jgi:hypothetical protein
MRARSASEGRSPLAFASGLPTVPRLLSFRPSLPVTEASRAALKAPALADANSIVVALIISDIECVQLNLMELAIRWELGFVDELVLMSERLHRTL